MSPSNSTPDPRRLVTYMMLAKIMPEQECPAEAELRLTKDGWRVVGGNYKEPIPVTVDMAYEMADYDQRVLDETRKLCGDLRVPAKRNTSVRKNLEALREELADARRMKAEKEQARASD